MNRIILSGYYGFNNAGDEAILKAIIVGLKQTIPNLDILVLSGNPKETQELYNVRAINRYNYAQIIHELIKTDLLISGGGSLLQDVTSKKTIPYYLSVIKLAQLLKVKTMVFSQGVGPISSKFLIKRVENVLKKTDLITVRDIISKKFLESLEVENVEITADPVFYLQPERESVVKNILVKEEIPFNESGPWIGVAMRDWGYDESCCKEIAVALDRLIANYDAQIIFMPFHFEVDKKLMERVREHMHANNQIYMINNQYQAHHLLGVCKHLDLMIGMRLHSLIFAARTKTPIVGISYDIKIDALMNQLGLDICCNTDNITSKVIYKYTSEILSKKRDFSEMMELVTDLEQNAWQAVIFATDLISGRI